MQRKYQTKTSDWSKSQHTQTIMDSFSYDPECMSQLWYLISYDLEAQPAIDKMQNSSWTMTWWPTVRGYGIKDPRAEIIMVDYGLSRLPMVRQLCYCAIVLISFWVIIQIFCSQIEGSQQKISLWLLYHDNCIKLLSSLHFNALSFSSPMIVIVCRYVYT